MLKDLSLQEFVGEVASASPAPGGGSVAALAAAQAAGLLSMYCNLSQNRERLGSAVDRLRDAGEEARFLKEKLLEAVDEDTVAFNRVMEAYRLEKDGLEQKQRRRAAIRQATLQAADVPLQAARGALRLLSLVGDVAGQGNPAALTDLGVANLQAFCGLHGALYNVFINLKGLKDGGPEQGMHDEAKNLSREGEKLFAANRETIEAELHH